MHRTQKARCWVVRRRRSSTTEILRRLDCSRINSDGAATHTSNQVAGLEARAAAAMAEVAYNTAYHYRICAPSCKYCFWSRVL